MSDIKQSAQSTQPAATVIKRGAARQWMSESLGHLPDGTYSLYLESAQTADTLLLELWLEGGGNADIKAPTRQEVLDLVHTLSKLANEAIESEEMQSTPMIGSRLDKYLTSNYPDTPGVTVTDRAIEALQKMDIELGMQSLYTAVLPLTLDEINDLWDAQIINVTDRISATQFIRDIESALDIARRSANRAGSLQPLFKAEHHPDNLFPDPEYKAADHDGDNSAATKRSAPAAQSDVSDVTDAVNLCSVAKYKLDQLKLDGFTVNGFAIERRSPGSGDVGEVGAVGDTVKRGFITDGGMVCWWEDTDHEPMSTPKLGQDSQSTPLPVQSAVDEGIHQIIVEGASHRVLVARYLDFYDKHKSEFQLQGRTWIWRKNNKDRYDASSILQVIRVAISTTESQAEHVAIQGKDALEAPITKLAQITHPITQILTWASDYQKEGGHGLIVQMLRSYADLIAQPARQEDLMALVKRVHKARGRYTSQVTMCDLYDACGLSNVRPDGVQPAASTVDVDDARTVLIHSLMASKGWLNGYAMAFVDDYLDRSHQAHEATKNQDALPESVQSAIRVTRIELTAAQRESLRCKNEVNIPGFSGALNAAENTGSSKEEKQSRTAIGNCWCEACVPQGGLLNLENTRMILCALCGNKRCPHATDHRNDCTQSNAPGQPGSSYAGVAAAFAALDLADLANMEVKAPTSKMEFATVWAYALPEGIKIESSPQRDGSMLWAVRLNGDCMGANGQWEYEPFPSNRDDGFFKRCRFSSSEAAYEAWLRSEKGEQHVRLQKSFK